MNQQDLRIIGLMSGTSLDGLDICYVKFSGSNTDWQFKIEAAQTIKYSSEWEQKLSQAQHLSAIEFVALHNEYGRFLGQAVSDFLAANPSLSRPDYIASHGHTVFHQPGKQLTWQIGSGASVAAVCGISTINDFRTLDVALHGQGAPLVPIGDELLFANYAGCLNLGGFANISFSVNNTRLAYDICPVNIVLNQLSQRCGKPYDDNGLLAAQGVVDNTLLAALNKLPFYAQSGPKSLGREWVESTVMPIINESQLNIHNRLRTVVEHIATQIAAVIQPTNGEILTTGGGAYNSFLIERIIAVSNRKIVVPEPFIIEFKEALIFAFLGLLRATNQPNALRSVTGATVNNCGGVIWTV